MRMTARILALFGERKVTQMRRNLPSLFLAHLPKIEWPLIYAALTPFLKPMAIGLH